MIGVFGNISGSLLSGFNLGNLQLIVVIVKRAVLHSWCILAIASWTLCKGWLRGLVDFGSYIICNRVQGTLYPGKLKEVASFKCLSSAIGQGISHE